MLLIKHDLYSYIRHTHSTHLKGSDGRVCPGFRKATSPAICPRLDAEHPEPPEWSQDPSLRGLPSQEPGKSAQERDKRYHEMGYLR